MRLAVRSKKEISPLGLGLMSVPFLAAGSLLLAVALGWIGRGSAEASAPPWVVGLAALVFLGGGFALLGMAFGRPRAAVVGAAVIAVGVTAVFHWVAFGGGSREFTARGEAAGVRTERAVGKGDGRVAFGAFAIGMDVALAAGTIAWWRRRRRGARPAGG